MTTNGRWTEQDIPDQSGKIAIVTGANSGIGYATSQELARKGAQIIMACRSMDKGQTAAQQIRREFPAASVEVMALDLSDLSSVRHFAEGFNSQHEKLDLLINNAGVMAIPLARTPDGFEMQFGTNHLGHFALTGLLLERILATPAARVVTVSSGAHRRGQIDFDDLNSERSYSRYGAYSQSKLANLLFTYELGRRFQASGVDAISVAAHPGWTATNLQRGLIRFLSRLVSQNQAMGALPTLYAATAPDVQSGDYYGPDGFRETRGYPTKVPSTARSHDREVAARLWTVSEELTGVPFTALAA